MAQDIDDFILVANTMIARGNKSEKTKGVAKKKEERIRVNDKTATGGWF